MMYDVNGKVFMHNEPESAAEFFTKEDYSEKTKWKLNVLKNYDIFNTDNLFLGARQNGKTTFMIKLVLSLVHSNQNKNIAIFSYNTTQAAEIRNNLLNTFHSLSETFHMPKITTNMSSHIEFSNGNVVYFRSFEAANALRGRSFDHFFVDLFLYQKKKSTDVFFNTIAPMKKRRCSITAFSDINPACDYDVKKDLKILKTVKV